MRIGGKGRGDDGDSARTDRIGWDETQRRRRSSSRERSRGRSRGGGCGRVPSSRNAGNDRGRRPRDDGDVCPGGHPGDQHRRDDRAPVITIRDGHGQDWSDGVGSASGPKRPPSPVAASADDGQKHGLDRRSEVCILETRQSARELQGVASPLGRHGLVTAQRVLRRRERNDRARMIAMEVPSAAAKSSDVGFAASEDEEAKANDAAFRECLRDVDKGHSVWELAHQLPRRRWNERERKAAIATIKSVSADLMSGRISRPNQHQYEFESHSSDDKHPPGVSDGKIFQRELLRMEARLINAELSQMETRFIDALPHCLPLNRGFHVTEFGASEICYCPCGQNVKPWRKKHEIIIPHCNQKERFQPNDLMDHLKKQGGVYEEKEKGKVVFRNLKCFYHYATAVYLRTLYSDWHFSCNTCKRMDWSALFLIFHADSLSLLHILYVRPKILVTRRFILDSARNTEGRMTKTVGLSGRPWRLKTERTRGSRGRWKRMRGFRQSSPIFEILQRIVSKTFRSIRR